MKVENRRNDFFINLKKEKLPLSFYLIRKSLLEAVKEVKPLLHGDVLDLACGIMPYRNFLMNDKINKYIGVDLEPTEYHNSLSQIITGTVKQSHFLTHQLILYWQLNF